MLTAREKDRYERQVLFAPIGETGQERMRDATVLIAGIGALGTSAANMLARAGVGHLRLVDHDVVELSNLQRQSIYDEDDVEGARSKALVAAEKLLQANSDVKVEAIVAKVEAENVSELLQGVDLVVDGVDNFAAKFAINQACVKHGIPFVYGAVSGSYGLTKIVRPGETACLCCLYCDEPDADSSETAATAGVIAPVVNTIASLQVAAALKLLAGAEADTIDDLIQIDVWDGELNLIPVERKPECAVCGLSATTSE